MDRSLIVKGDFCYSTDARKIVCAENCYLVCVNGMVQGIFQQLSPEYAHLPIHDFSGKLIVPGFTDIHIHAPQFTFRGLGMDLELLEWLNTHTFPEEAKFADADYAAEAYSYFVEDLKSGATTRACVYATAHTDATLILMELLEQSGLVSFVGRVNMDRNAPDALREESATFSVQETVRWLEASSTRFENTKPILTPRFIPSCTDELLKQLSVLQKNYQLPLQSHLSENESECQWVQELCPNAKFYGDAYDRLGLFGAQGKTIMAHCVLSGSEEIALMKERGVYIAHCPQSNENLSSGIAPARTYLDMKIPMGLGTDVAGGSSTSMLRCMSDAIQVSKLRWRLVDQSLAPLTMPEVFYLATMGGGSFFGKTGSFLPGYEADLVVFDDSRLRSTLRFSPAERLERLIYLGDDRDVAAKFVRGNMVLNRM